MYVNRRAQVDFGLKVRAFDRDRIDPGIRTDNSEETGLSLPFRS